MKQSLNDSNLRRLAEAVPPVIGGQGIGEESKDNIFRPEGLRGEDEVRVTCPVVPELGDLLPLLREVWENDWLTNNGPLHQQLERRLREYLGVENISLFTNGTLPLVTALQALEISGEVITTPYSFVATAHSLHWNGLTPVFADVDPIYGNLLPEAIERAITPRTRAILAVHVYGNPAPMTEIEQIASQHGLRVIYDAAHAFGVRKDGESILRHGDISTLSFHATKTFSTAEGGALISADSAMKQRVDYLKNFGFADETHVIMPGINSKMDEIRAAIGLKGLEIAGLARERRHAATLMYRELLADIPGLRFLEDMPGVEHNYGYFPIFINAKEFGMTRDELYQLLKNHNIFGRRYFYPLISDFSPYNLLPSARKENLPNAVRLASEVICLPMHHKLNETILRNIAEIIRQKK